jgi:hypothetical protein
MLNWKELLLKYMEHVGECEGVYFIHELAFTPEDYAALMEIREMLRKKYNAG